LAKIEKENPGSGRLILTKICGCFCRFSAYRLRPALMSESLMKLKILFVLCVCARARTPPHPSLNFVSTSYRSNMSQNICVMTAFYLEKGGPRGFWQKNLQDLDSILLKPISIVFFANLLTQSLEDSSTAFALFLRHSLPIVHFISNFFPSSKDVYTVGLTANFCTCLTSYSLLLQASPVTLNHKRSKKQTFYRPWAQSLIHGNLSHSLLANQFKLPFLSWTYRTEGPEGLGRKKSIFGLSVVETILVQHRTRITLTDKCTPIIGIWIFLFHCQLSFS
jgi:hypothetical protein